MRRKTKNKKTTTQLKKSKGGGQAIMLYDITWKNITHSIDRLEAWRDFPLLLIHFFFLFLFLTWVWQPHWASKMSGGREKKYVIAWKMFNFFSYKNTRKSKTYSWSTLKGIFFITKRIIQCIYFFKEQLHPFFVTTSDLPSTGSFGRATSGLLSRTLSVSGNDHNNKVAAVTSSIRWHYKIFIPALVVV